MTKAKNPRPARPFRLVAALASAKETIFFFVSAFIFVAVFRGFIAEGFCIPTGSMAPTLYGLHQTRVCRECGFEFAYNIQQTPDAQGRLITSGPRMNVCPNCLHPDKPLPLENNGRGLLERGDQIFVLKLGFELADRFPSLARYCGPKRWDVVVFKDPSDPNTSFIKRLIGLPGEKIEIVDGDIYVNDTIARKTPAAEESLWLPVFDADLRPVGKDRADAPRLPGWIPGDAAGRKIWNTGGRRMIFSALGQSGTVAFNRPVRDYYAYDDPDYPLNARNLVSDLKVQFLLVPQKGDGELEMILSKRQDVFIARIRVAGTAEVTRVSLVDFLAGKTAGQVIGTAAFPALQAGRPRVVSFENVDYRVRLKIDGRTLIETTDQEYHPDLAALRTASGPGGQIVRLKARNLAGELWHLKLLRDIYYQSTSFIENRNRAGEPNPLYGQPGHGTTGNPIRLGPREYFVLGDNSPMSKDSRAWWEVGPHLADRYRRGEYHLGTVPADQMIGRAFVVYLPAPFRIFSVGPAVIPNLREVRFIR